MGDVALKYLRQSFSILDIGIGNLVVQNTEENRLFYVVFIVTGSRFNRSSPNRTKTRESLEKVVVLFFGCEGRCLLGSKGGRLLVG